MSGAQTDAQSRYELLLRAEDFLLSIAALLHREAPNTCARAMDLYASLLSDGTSASQEQAKRVFAAYAGKADGGLAEDVAIPAFAQGRYPFDAPAARAPGASAAAHRGVPEPVGRPAPQSLRALASQDRPRTTRRKHAMNFDDLLELIQPATISGFVQPMATADLKAFSLHLGNKVANTPRSDPGWHRLDLLDKGAMSELLMPHRAAELTALMPAPAADLPLAPLSADGIELELAALLSRHGQDLRCRMHDYRLATFVVGVLDALARASGQAATDTSL